jgi:hypothetical protein
MSWLAVGDWAEEMSEKIHKQRLRIAAKHFGVDLGHILGDDEQEKKLLTRYEVAGLDWPAIPDDEDQ